MKYFALFKVILDFHIIVTFNPYDSAYVNFQISRTPPLDDYWKFIKIKYSVYTFL